MPVTALGMGLAANETNKQVLSPHEVYILIDDNVRQDEGKTNEWSEGGWLSIRESEMACLRKRPDDRESATLREDRSGARELQAQRLWGRNELGVREGQMKANVAEARWTMELGARGELERTAEVLMTIKSLDFITAIKLNISKTELLVFFPKPDSLRF